MFCSQTSLYRIGLVGHLFFKCDEMRLSWVFYRQNTNHSPEKYHWIRAVYKGEPVEVLLGKVLNKILSPLSQYCPTWRSGNENGPARRGSWVKFRVEPTFLFSFFFLFFFSFLFIYLFIYLFLAILVLFCFFIQSKFFKFIKFPPDCFNSISSYFLPLPRSATRGPAIHVFLVSA